MMVTRDHIDCMMRQRDEWLFQADSHESLGAPSHVVDELRHRAECLTALIEAVERLPETADGVRVVPGMDVWDEEGNSGIVTEVDGYGYTVMFQYPKLARQLRSGEEGFSTAESALAASGGGNNE